MALLVEDAFRLWREIPEADLTSAVEEAIREAGAFMATAGLVAKCWSKRTTGKILELSAPKCSSTLEEYEAARARWDSMTPEEQEQEREAHRAFFGGLAKKLAGGAA